MCQKFQQLIKGRERVVVPVVAADQIVSSSLNTHLKCRKERHPPVPRTHPSIQKQT